MPLCLYVFAAVSVCVCRCVCMCVLLCLYVYAAVFVRAYDLKAFGLSRLEGTGVRAWDFSLSLSLSFSLSLSLRRCLVLCRHCLGSKFSSLGCRFKILLIRIFCCTVPRLGTWEDADTRKYSEIRHGACDRCVVRFVHLNRRNVDEVFVLALPWD